MNVQALVIGASGQIGHNIFGALSERNVMAAGTYGSHPAPGLEQLNIIDAGAVWELVHRLRPKVIYLTASLSNVDYCEQYPQEGYMANVQGVFNVVRAANSISALVIYLSSDYVFDGIAGPYSEEDLPNPICEYGKQKVLAEHIVGLQAARAIIARTTVVFGPERLGKNFIYRLVGTLRQGKEIRVPSDQIGSPTYGPDLAHRLIDLAQSESTGLFHITGPERVSRYELALTAARVFSLPTALVRPVETRDLGQPALRPLNAGLKIDKFVATTGNRTMRFHEGLQAMRDHLAAAGQIP